MSIPSPFLKNLATSMAMSAAGLDLPRLCAGCLPLARHPEGSAAAGTGDGSGCWGTCWWVDVIVWLIVILIVALGCVIWRWVLGVFQMHQEPLIQVFFFWILGLRSATELCSVDFSKYSFHTLQVSDFPLSILYAVMMDPSSVWGKI